MAAAGLVQFAVVIVLALWLIVIVVKKGFLVFSQFYQIRFLKNLTELVDLLCCGFTCSESSASARGAAAQ